MKKELQYLIINYSNEDREYIDELCVFLDNKTKEIISFFEIKYYSLKVNVKLYSNLEEFRRECKKYKGDNIPDWLCGLTISQDEIITLCLKEYKKTLHHENHSLNSIKSLILHEFVHSVHQYINNNMHVAWLSEGLATYLSHQYDNCKKEFNVSLDEMIKGTSNYSAYYLMFSYVYNTYGKDYILNLLNDVDYLLSETPRLYDEAKNNLK